ncbi:hypothetical protein CONLIGDRAFT_324856 [Coniochaeta ligniaria NRRL 30616]|uniref:Uncharacterized protein n=1 Tax=Coniochaeta ligniaria NRRL 30616 TaxID=1408157 RepID=A0A1J7JNV8_9PEZI|nr:hypothetical protein CONLIGDRAFT_324856 [Coniochaeta ligniaria NRRL 30616]
MAYQSSTEIMINEWPLTDRYYPYRRIIVFFMTVRQRRPAMMRQSHTSLVERRSSSGRRASILIECMYEVVACTNLTRPSKLVAAYNRRCMTTDGRQTTRMLSFRCCYSSTSKSRGSNTGFLSSESAPPPLHHRIYGQIQSSANDGFADDNRGRPVTATTAKACNESRMTICGCNPPPPLSGGLRGIWL